MLDRANGRVAVLLDHTADDAPKADDPMALPAFFAASKRTRIAVKPDNLLVLSEDPSPGGAAGAAAGGEAKAAAADEAGAAAVDVANDAAGAGQPASVEDVAEVAAAQAAAAAQGGAKAYDEEEEDIYATAESAVGAMADAEVAAATISRTTGKQFR